MNRSSKPAISDELLSAYIDGLVTSEERERIEAAMAADPDLAWEIDTLRQTVELVQALPPVALPRPFALNEEDVADVLVQRRARAAKPLAIPPKRVQRPAPPKANNRWQQILAFFDSGNLFLRNATAVAALFLVIVLITAPSSPIPLSPSAMSTASDAAVMDSSAGLDSPAAMKSANSDEPSVDETPAIDTHSADTRASAEIQTVTAASEAETAPVAEMAAPQPLEAAAAPMARSAPPGVMRSAPESQNSFAAPSAQNGGIGGAADSALRQEMPGSAPAGVMPSQGETNSPVGAESAADEPITEVYSADETMTDESVTRETVAEEPIALESAREQVAVEDAQADASTNIQPELFDRAQPQAETAREGLTQESVQESVLGSQSVWQLLQVILGVLALLLGALWLRSRQTATPHPE